MKNPTITMQTINIDVAARLKEIREGRRKTQGHIAAQIGVKRGTYQAYEERRSTPPLSILIKLAELYGFHSLDKLLGIVEIEHTQGDDLLLAYQSAKPENQQIVNLALNYNC